MNFFVEEDYVEQDPIIFRPVLQNGLALKELMFGFVFTGFSIAFFNILFKNYNDHGQAFEYWIALLLATIFFCFGIYRIIYQIRLIQILHSPFAQIVFYPEEVEIPKSWISDKGYRKIPYGDIYYTEMDKGDLLISTPGRGVRIDKQLFPLLTILKMNEMLLRRAKNAKTAHQ